MYTPPLITFEGLDFSGKSLQRIMLISKLREQGFSVRAVREPGGTPYAERVRDCIMHDKSEDVNAVSNCMMFGAARADVTKNVILPSLKSGKIVVSDRYTHSTLAYQHYGNGLDLNTVETLCRISSYGVIPRLTIYLDIGIRELIIRRAAAVRRNAITNPRDWETNDFYTRVRNGYLVMLGRPNPYGTDQALVLDGTRPVSEIGEVIWEVVQPIVSGGVDLQ